MNSGFARLVRSFCCVALCALLYSDSGRCSELRAMFQVPPQISESTVRIRVETQTNSHTVVGHGSAFGVDLSAYGIHKTRYLLSAAHLVLSEETGKLINGKISVEIPGHNRKTWVSCHVLSVTRFYDLCLLECDEDVPVLSKLAGNKSSISVGSPILVVGCPLGVPPQVSSGYLSDKEPLVNERYHRVWEATAAFNHGNSGGPVFTEKGAILGVAVAGVRAGGGGPQDMDPSIALFTPYYCVKHFLDVSIVRMAK